MGEVLEQVEIVAGSGMGLPLGLDWTEPDAAGETLADLVPPTKEAAAAMSRRRASCWSARA